MNESVNEWTYTSRRGRAENWSPTVTLGPSACITSIGRWSTSDNARIYEQQTCSSVNTAQKWCSKILNALVRVVDQVNTPVWTENWYKRMMRAEHLDSAHLCQGESGSDADAKSRSDRKTLWGLPCPKIRLPQDFQEVPISFSIQRANCGKMPHVTMLKNPWKNILDPDPEMDNFQNLTSSSCLQTHLWQNFHGDSISSLANGQTNAR